MVNSKRLKREVTKKKWLPIWNHSIFWLLLETTRFSSCVNDPQKTGHFNWLPTVNYRASTLDQLILYVLWFCAMQKTKHMTYFMNIEHIHMAMGNWWFNGFYERRLLFQIRRKRKKNNLSTFVDRGDFEKRKFNLKSIRFGFAFILKRRENSKNVKSWLFFEIHHQTSFILIHSFFFFVSWIHVDPILIHILQLRHFR